MHSFQPLEARRLFAGGVDSSFGSAQGASFDPSGELFVRDTAVDRFGRMVFAGLQYSDTEDTHDLYLSRLNADGQVDASFGVAGTVRGTLKGVKELVQIIGRIGGGYVASGRTSSGTRLIAFDESGRVDRAYGKDGIVSLNNLLDVKLLQQADGKLIVLGTDAARDGASGNDRFRYAIRVLTTGRLDATWGDRGEVNLGLSSGSDSRPTLINELTSASIDGGGRLVLTFTNTETTRDPITSAITKLATRTFQQRLGGNGAADPKFVGRFINRDSSDTDISSVDVITAVSVTRPDGQVAVLTRNRDEPDFPISLSLRGANGQLAQNRAPSVGQIVGGTFAVENLVDGVLVATADNQLIIAGVLLKNGGRTPALIRFDQDLTRDFSFGDNGFMRLPGTADGYQPEYLTLNADSTLNVYVRDPENMPSTGDRRAVRVFQDDRPVASLRGISRKGDQIRLTLSVRGIDPINVASLGSDDFRIRAVGPGGGAVPGLISLTDAGNGDALLTLGVNRPRGAYDIVALSRRVSDDDGDFVRAGTFATVTI